MVWTDSARYNLFFLLFISHCYKSGFTFQEKKKKEKEAAKVAQGGKVGLAGGFASLMECFFSYFSPLSLM